MFMPERKDIVGGDEGYFPIHNRKFPRSYQTVEKIEMKREQLKKRWELWDAERELEDELLEFREVQEAWLEDIVTLDDVLERMMEMGLCKKLSVWKEKKIKQTHTHTNTHDNTRPDIQ